jgi:hypothetical protein
MKMVKWNASYIVYDKGLANKDNFFVRSLADFTPCSAPETTPDITSKSGSSYWYTRDGVIRVSDHWGGVATCRWTLDGTEVKSESPLAAFCRWEDISLAVYKDIIVEFPENAKMKPLMPFGDKIIAINEKVA